MECNSVVTWMGTTLGNLPSALSCPAPNLPCLATVCGLQGAPTPPVLFDASNCVVEYVAACKDPFHAAISKIVNRGLVLGYRQAWKLTKAAAIRMQAPCEA